MEDRQINNLLAQGWEKAMSDEKSPAPFIFSAEEFGWYTFGYNMGTSVRELRGTREVPKIEVSPEAFTPQESNWFKGAL